MRRQAGQDARHRGVRHRRPLLVEARRLDALDEVEEVLVGDGGRGERGGQHAALVLKAGRLEGREGRTGAGGGRGGGRGCGRGTVGTASGAGNTLRWSKALVQGEGDGEWEGDGGVGGGRECGRGMEGVVNGDRGNYRGLQAMLTFHNSSEATALP